MKPLPALSFFRVTAVIIAATFTAIAPASLAATDGFEAYRLQQQQGAQKIIAEFHEYKENQDREFSSFLKSQWREFETYQGMVRIKEPKPRQLPVAVPDAQPAPAKPVAVPEPVIPRTIPDAKAKPAPVVPTPAVPTPVTPTPVVPPTPVAPAPVIAPVAVAPVIAPPPRHNRSQCR